MYTHRQEVRYDTSENTEGTPAYLPNEELRFNQVSLNGKGAAVVESLILRQWYFPR